MASPFAVRSFRFQWPADLATSWAFEMEALILGWYILATTGSVQQLVIVAALVWLGSLFSPFFGVAGDRIGHRTLLCITRGLYALLAAVLTALTLSEALRPWHVFVIAALAGLLRPSDMVMRHVLVSQTMRPDMLLTLARVPGVFDEPYRVHRLRIPKSPACLLCSSVPVPYAGEKLDEALDHALDRLAHE